MSTSDVSHVGFRRLQAVRDLRAVARTASQATIRRIIEGALPAVSESAFAILDGARGFRLPDPALSQSFLLSGSLPDDDFDAFRISTAILLADRLQNGIIEDNLFWYWDAFQSHYALMPRWQTAAVMTGYAQAHHDGLVDLCDPPAKALRQSRDETTLQLIIQNAPDEAMTVLQSPDAILDPTPDLGLKIWEIFISPAHPARRDLALTAVLRHFYETNLSFDPTDGRHFPLLSDEPPPIPPATED